MSQYWICKDEAQAADLYHHILDKVYKGEIPRLKFITHPEDKKSGQQVRYAHSLCQSLADYKQVVLEVAKKDAKVAFGVIKVSQSIVTGDRSARLSSFSDYTKAEMMGFLKAMEAHLDENEIPYTPAGEGE